MCLAIPGKIVTMNQYNATVDIMGLKSTINLCLIEKPQIGDYVLVHAGCAIQKIDKEYFDDLLTTFSLMS
jgi:hydrogenase expression/formation protein HypC